MCQCQSAATSGSSGSYSTSPASSWWSKKDELGTPSVTRVEKGLGNLGKHLENMKLFGMKAVVAINLFPGDTEEEITAIKHFCNRYETEAISCTGFTDGGKGMTELACAVDELIQKDESDFRPLYERALPIEEKFISSPQKYTERMEWNMP